MCDDYKIPVDWKSLSEKRRINSSVYSGKFETISPEAVNSKQFLYEYNSCANKYALFNEEKGIGNKNYRRATTCKLQNLINVINLTYKK